MAGPVLPGVGVLIWTSATVNCCPGFFSSWPQESSQGEALEPAASTNPWQPLSGFYCLPSYLSGL